MLVLGTYFHIKRRTTNLQRYFDDKKRLTKLLYKVEEVVAVRQAHCDIFFSEDLLRSRRSRRRRWKAVW
jgi:hypothetical protein